MRLNHSRPLLLSTFIFLSSTLTTNSTSTSFSTSTFTKPSPFFFSFSPPFFFASKLNDLGFFLLPVLLLLHISIPVLVCFHFHGPLLLPLTFTLVSVPSSTAFPSRAPSLPLPANTHTSMQCMHSSISIVQLPVSSTPTDQSSTRHKQLQSNSLSHSLPHISPTNSPCQPQCEPQSPS
uniref:Ovule protein n=1 Tax=Echinococcus granulosus TaxID=6210 RepID=A0A068WT43_ECHGR|nr:hypothetical protein EgrG_002038500 [Echinococcus granulosus]